MKVWETYHIAKRFKAVTGMDFRRFVDIFADGDVSLNVQELEKFIQPDEKESVEECVRRKYGDFLADNLKLIV